MTTRGQLQGSLRRRFGWWAEHLDEEQLDYVSEHWEDITELIGTWCLYRPARTTANGARTCRVCHRALLVNLDGTMRRHRTGKNACQGSGLPPEGIS